ncbi:MAG: D-2-hydroxyacid dehydrogenase [Planctomycetota bacterium]|jgi:glycerate dehydrogenase
MKIIVIDGATLNPGDLSWDDLKKLGPCEIYDRSTPWEKLQRCKDADIVITNKVMFDRDTILKLPNLKYIGVTATGYNVIDIEAAKEKNIIVTNVPSYASESVAQAVFALLLELCNHVGHHSQTVKAGKWASSPDFCYWDFPLVELKGLTMGIVGCGRIGRVVAKIAHAFDMQVLGYDKYYTEVEGIQMVDLERLFSKSDVISLHCPLTAETEGLVNKELLSKMKSTAFLINTSRGPLICEKDLAQALQNGRIAGAAVDVLSGEPPTPDNPLMYAKNCYITPHIAWATQAARQRLMDVTVENTRAFINEKPVNVVSS